MKTVIRRWGVAAVSMLGATAWGAGEPAERVPLAASQPQSAYSWGPYTQEGMALSERTRERFGWAVGPAVVQPHARAMAVYEDNVQPNSGKKDDEAYTVFTPGAMLLLGNPRQNYGYLDYSADFTTLQVGDSDAFDGQTVKVGARVQQAKTQVDLSHAYEESRDINVQVGTRLKQRANTTAAGVDTRLNSKTSVGVLGRHELREFDDSVYADYREYEGGGRFVWQARPKTAFFTDASHGWIDIDGSRDAFGSGQYNEVAIGIHGRPHARWETSGQIGVQQRTFEDEAIDDVTREVGQLRVSGEPVEFFRLWVQGSAGLRPAIASPGFTVFDTRIEPGISRRVFSDRVIAAVSGVWGGTEYIGTSDPAGEPDERVYDGRKDSYWGLNANLDWWIGRYWAAGAGYSYINSDSDADGLVVDGRPADPSSYDNGRWTFRVSFNR